MSLTQHNRSATGFDFADLAEHVTGTPAGPPLSPPGCRLCGDTGVIRSVTPAPPGFQPQVQEHACSCLRRRRRTRA